MSAPPSDADGCLAVPKGNLPLLALPSLLHKLRKILTNKNKIGQHSFEAQIEVRGLKIGMRFELNFFNRRAEDVQKKYNYNSRVGGRASKKARVAWLERERDSRTNKWFVDQWSSKGGKIRRGEGGGHIYKNEARFPMLGGLSEDNDKIEYLYVFAISLFLSLSSCFSSAIPVYLALLLIIEKKRRVFIIFCSSDISHDCAYCRVSCHCWRFRSVRLYSWRSS